MGQFNTIPPNPFPPSSESAGNGGGGEYVLPIASASKLGGVKVGNNLSIDGNGALSAPAPYTLPTASADTLGGVKVGDGLSIADGVLSADKQTVDFSTTETDTGVKWIDGKEIYCKVISGLSISSATTWTTTGVDISDIETIIGGVAIDNAGQFIASSLGGTNGDILLVRSMFDGNTITTVVVYYTKVTV